MKFIDETNKISIEFEEKDTMEQKKMAFNAFFFICNLVKELQNKNS
jgi:hypothetical protein